MTLTETARLTRKVVFWGVVILILFIFLRVTISVGTGVFRFFFPKPTPAPSVAFGKLTPFDFSKNPISDSKNVTFELKTIEGSLPNLGNQAKVFKVGQIPPTILFGEKAREEAAKLKFFSEPEIRQDRIYVFSDPAFPERKLEMDVITGNFKITNNINQYPEILTMAGQLTKDDAVRIAKNFLTMQNLLQKDFSDDKIIVTPLKIEGGNLLKADSFAQNHLIRVGFAKSDLEKLPILSADFDKTNVWVEVTPIQEPTKQIFQAWYFYYLADTKNSSTYPIKSTQTAFGELAAGQGIIVGQKLEKLEIRRVYLAYVETVSPMSFFVPVYVFTGDNFSAFVTAVPSEWFGP